MLLSTFSGGALMGYIARNDPGGHPRTPQSAVEHISTKISDITGAREAGFFGYALLAAVLLFPLLWRTPARQPMAFSTIAMVVAWIQMLFAKGAGFVRQEKVTPFPSTNICEILNSKYDRTLKIFIGECIDNSTINNTEHDRRRTDAESQGEDCD